jgi:MYXO-CTERM domain-containing protein
VALRLSSCACAALLVGVAARPVAAETAAEARQRAVAAAGAVKVIVRGAGSWIRVTQPELRAAGLPAGVDPAKLQVFADGLEQAVVVTGDGDATFGPDEALELWGVGRDTLSTDARTYWVVAGAAAGARVAKVFPPAPGEAAPASFTRTARVADKKIYLSAVRNGEASNFFAAPVSATASTIKVAASRVAGGEAIVRVSLQGMTKGPHVVDVSVGGALAGTCTYADRDAKSCAFAAAAVEGDNAVTLAARGGAGDFSALSGVELDYAHAWTADDDALAFTAPAATRVEIAGFSSSDVRVVDVTDAAHPAELKVVSAAQGATYVAQVDLAPGAGPRSLYAFTAARAAKAAAVTADAPSRWGDDALEGELVILSHARFLEAMAPLAARRAQEGWKVQLIDLQDVYDERGGGDKSVGAVRAFLRAARDRWRVPPRFVLLVGDASFDPRNFTGMGDFDLAPTKMIDATTMETASDDWIADFDDDGLPELAVGRFPVRTKEEAALLVDKTLGYTADLSRGGLFVTDKNGDGLDFEAASAAAEAQVADLMPIDRYRRGDAAATPAALLAKLNDGPFLVNYLGHGSVEVWEGSLTSGQAKALTNAKTSIYVVMNCLNGFFHDLYTESVAEALLKAPQGGAVAVWASSDLAEYAPQPDFNQAFLARLARTSMGQAAMSAKSAITDVEARRTWLLFGDPTLLGGPTPPADADGGVTDPIPRDAGAQDAGAASDAGAPPITPDAAAPSDAGAPPSDAGAPSADAASASDAATPATVATEGCGCRAGGGAPASALALLLAVGGLAAARRRRAPASRRWPSALLALTVALGAFAAPRAASAAYAYRKSLTIDRNRIGTASGATTLTNYPLLISMTDANLKTTANMGHVENANGYDITFTGADTTTCGGPSTCTFNYEIEKYVATTGELVAWVQIPVLKTVANSSNTVIYIKYGDTTISSPTQNANGTWDSNYKGVWHLNQSPGGAAPQMTDSTSTAGHATATNGPTANSSAKIGAGVTLDGTDDHFAFNAPTAFDFTGAETFTMSGWFLTSDSYGPLQSFRGSVNGNPVIDIHVGYDGATTDAGKLLVLVRDDTGVSYAQVNGGAVANGAWHLYTVTRNAGTISVYLDGAFVTSATNAGAAGAITTNLRNWGRDGNWVSANYGTADQRYLAGSLDEMRISKSLRAAEWIATDYLTQNAPASTFTASGEALASCGDGTKLMAEACDDGNIVAGDGCSSACTVESGYSCTTASPSVCTTVCGDGIVVGSEGCDDGGTANGNGCSSTCAVETGYHCTGAPSTCTFAQFDYLKNVTVDRTKVGSASAPTTISGFPVLVSVTDANLKTTANMGHVRNANGYDILFRAYDTVTCGGTTQCTLPHEIEKYDGTTGQLIAWVYTAGLKTQTNTSNTTFQILYGNQAVSSSLEQKASTWASSFKGVWHLNQDPSGSAPQMTDSSTTGNNGTSSSLTAVSSAKVGAGVSTNGTSSSMTFNSGTTLNSAGGAAFTYSAWIKVPATETLGAIVSSRSSTADAVVIDLMVGMNGPTTNAGKLMALVRDDTNGAYGQLVGGTVNDDVWHHVALVRSNTAVALYLDGVSQGGGPVTATGVGGTYTTNLRDMGREGRWIQDNYTTPTSNAFLQATFDELRYASAARNADWLLTEYANQGTPSTFLSFGSETAANGSTAAMVASFDATETCAGTTLRWQTTYEVDTLGFNVYRVVGGRREQLNAAMIPGAALSGGRARHYELVDGGALDPARTYWLEIVHFSAENDLRGPATPNAALACEPARPRPAPAPLAAAPLGPSADEPDLAAGGCAIAGGNGGALGLLAAVALLVRARRGARKS